MSTKYWVNSGEHISCPDCGAVWSKLSNETNRFLVCPSCGITLLSSDKPARLSMQLSVTKTHCSPKKFVINGVKATTYDFGQGVDEEPVGDGKFGCGCHAFHHFERPKHGVLEKYHISMDDYRHICTQLDSQLSRGRCKYCG